MSVKVVAIIQARMTSSRLPGKVLEEVAGKPLLAHMLERLQRCETLDEIVVAVPKRRESQPIVQLVADLISEDGWESRMGWVKGDETDVLGRVLHAANMTLADVVVELTADCPLMDPEIVDRAVRFYRLYGWESPQIDLASTSRDSTRAPEKAYPRGMDVRIMSRKCLEKIDRLTDDPVDREHVSLYAWTHPEQFRVGNMMAYPEFLADDVRLTVDTPEDLHLVRLIFEALYPANPEFGLEEIMALLAANPDWRNINAGVQQKEIR